MPNSSNSFFSNKFQIADDIRAPLGSKLPPPKKKFHFSGLPPGVAPLCVLCRRDNECLSATTALMEPRDKEVNSADFITRYSSHTGASDDNMLLSVYHKSNTFFDC